VDTSDPKAPVYNLIFDIVSHEARVRELESIRQRWIRAERWDEVDAVDVLIRDEQQTAQALRQALEAHRPKRVGAGPS
jgi:predicted glycosyltransferase